MNRLKKIVKSLLAIPWIRKLYESSNRVILSIFSSNRLLATLYSFLGFITFNREQYAVIKGRKRYYDNLKKQSRSHVGLRRNTHRLEKGMLMKPRREIFALDYIEEILDFYEKALKSESQGGDIDKSELNWARDVISKYFELITHNDLTKRLQQKFTELNHLVDVQNTKKVPYKRRDSKELTIDYDDMLKLSQRRRSVRWFEEKKVPRELIDKAVKVARQAPTACNRMPYEFRFYDDPELVKKVSSIPFGAAGYSHNIPTIAVIVGKQDSYFSPRDRHVVYIDASLAAMSFMFALETLGLASSVINWPDFEPLEIKMQKTLGLRVDERPVMLMAIGYPDPDGMVAYSQKKQLDSVRSYNKIGS